MVSPHEGAKMVGYSILVNPEEENNPRSISIIDKRHATRKSVRINVSINVTLNFSNSDIFATMKLAGEGGWRRNYLAYV